VPTRPWISWANRASTVASAAGVLEGVSGGELAGGRAAMPAPTASATADVRVARREHGGRRGGVHLGRAGRRHDLAAGIGHVRRQVDVQGADRRQQVAEARRVGERDVLDAEAQRGTELVAEGVLALGREGLGERQGVGAAPAARVGVDRDGDDAAAGPARLHHEDGQRRQLALAVDGGDRRHGRVREHQLVSASRRLGAVGGVVEGEGTDDRQRDDDGDRGGRGDGGDDGGAATAPGQRRHASLPYSPRSAITWSTGSVTR
jgi:hypothetical protein